MINPMNLSGSTILVTGASSGIGLATAILLSKLGAKIILVARNVEKLKQTAGLLEGTGHSIEQFDLKDVDMIPEWLKEIVKKNDVLRGIVHCAGVRFTLPLKMTDSKIIKDTFDTNLVAAIILAKAFSQKGIFSLNNNSIVFVSSVLGLVGKPGVSAYAASKGAIIALTKSLAAELARNKIRVNCIVPGVVKTEMVEQVGSLLTADQLREMESRHLLGFGESSDVANAAAFLLADSGKWITGTALVIDGGYTAC